MKWEAPQFIEGRRSRLDRINGMYLFYANKRDIDVSEIAKRYGGGGHKGAAGCDMTFKELNELVKF